MCDKRAFRRKKRAEIRYLPEEYIRRTDEMIASRLTSLPEYRHSERIFAYYSVGREVDTRRILRSAAADGKALFLPVVLGDGLMEFAQYDTDALLTGGLLDIPEPGKDAERAFPERDDLLLVPGLCFDHENYRLGQGGGYYDRFLAKTDAVTLGLARERLMPDAVPRERFDLPVGILLTEARCLRR